MTGAALLAEATNPIVRWEWVVDEWDQIQAAIVEHLVLTILALALGLAVSAVLSALVLRFRWTSAPITATTSLIYTLPSVALFALLAPVFGNLSRWTAVLPLAAYTLLILVTNTVAGFLAVPQAVRDAATGMGMSRMRRLRSVEFPLAVPYIVTGIRIAAVSTVGLVTVAAIIGQGGLGRLIFSGLRRTFWTPMTVGASLSIMLALLLDALIVMVAVAHAVAAEAGGAVSLVAQTAVPRDIGFFEWFFDADTWTGAGGILESLVDTVVLCAAATALAALIAVPIAAVLAHYHRAEVASTWLVSLSRAVPTFAIAALLVPWSLRRGWGFEPWPIFIALFLLALVPIYLNTYVAIRQVPEGSVDAARALGYGEGRILGRIEFALGASLIAAGIRVAAIQVVATEPIRAFLGGDGLGYVRDGFGQSNTTLVVGGIVLIGGLAAITGLVFVLLERLVLPTGVRRLARQQGDKRP